MTRARRTTLIAACFLLPNFLGFVVFLLGPVGFSLGASFTNWSLVQETPLRWVGLDNYADLVRSQDFWLYFTNTVYLMLGLPLSIAASLFLAILLHQRIRGAGLYRTLFYLPSFTAGVALLILWKALFNPNFGPINPMLEGMFAPMRLCVERFGAYWLLMGGEPGGLLERIARAPAWTGLMHIEPPLWLSSTRNLLGIAVERVEFSMAHFGLGARDAIIIMGVWTAAGGANMLLYLAGLSNIPPELYEAAEIDGAGPWAKFRHVTWPQLAPTTFFIVIISVIGGLQGGFEQARVMTEGGPAGTTTTLSYYIYIKAFEEFEIGYASAVAWILFSIVFGITLLNWRFGSRYVND